MLRPLVTAITLCVLLATCGQGELTDTTSAPDTPSPRASSSTASPLDGTWATDPISVADMEEVLRNNGLARWVTPFRQRAPIQGDTTLILEIHEGQWDLYGEPRGGEREEIDYDARYEIDGDRVVVSHEDESNTYRWSLDGDALSMEWLETTYADFEGFPEEVFQRALYMTAEFHRT